MANIVYSLLILAVAISSIWRGFRLGITRQIASLLGLTFGGVFARVLTPVLSPYFMWASNLSQAPEFSDFSVNMVCAVVIYSVVFALFYLLTPLVNLILSAIRVEMANRLAGTFFALLKNLLWLSIFMNLLVCFVPGSGLLRFEKANDGNLMAAVMALTPAILGCYGAEDFAHFHQLKEAKSISCNYRDRSIIFVDPEATEQRAG